MRERGAGDIARLASHFLTLYKKKHGKPDLRLGAEAEARLCAYRWPGNIRELEHCIEAAVVVCDGAEIDAAQLPLPTERTVLRKVGPFTPRTLADVEKEHIARTLDAVGGNRSEAARVLGIGRNTLLRKLKED